MIYGPGLVEQGGLSRAPLPRAFGGLWVNLRPHTVVADPTRWAARRVLPGQTWRRIRDSNS